MKGLIYTEWDNIELRDLPKPEPKDNEVLIRVSACGICGSEIESFRNRSGRRFPPIIMGHEFCGRIVKVGDRVRNWVKGQKVISHSLVHCGSCKCCINGNTNICQHRSLFGMHRPGAFAEFVAVPEHVLIEWPDTIDKNMATLTEPMTNGINAMEKVQENNPERILILGSGSMGIMCLHASNVMYNCQTVISDINPTRLDFASKLGANETVNPTSNDLINNITQVWNEELPDVIIDTVGNEQTKEQSIRLLAPGGTAIWLGLGQNKIALKTYPIPIKEKSIKGTYSGSMRQMRKAVNFLESKEIDTVGWVKTYPIEYGVEAFKLMAEGKSDNIKAIIHF
jgi:L-iditol 2-dehydrogenase